MPIPQTPDCLASAESRFQLFYSKVGISLVMPSVLCRDIPSGLLQRKSDGR